MNTKKIMPQCNLDTVRDGRGGIFTFYPDKPIVEFNFQFINKGKIRGNHSHPEFDEYYVITDGNGVLVSKDESGGEDFLYVGKGDCTYTPMGVTHVLYAITDMNIVTFLTKKWDDCKVPIIHENLGLGVGDHGDPNYKGVGKYSAPSTSSLLLRRGSEGQVKLRSTAEKRSTKKKK